MSKHKRASATTAAQQSLERAFIQSIQLAPEDDAPRLIFADWLEDNGQPERAEFIRIQCQMPLLPWNSPQRQAWQERQGSILQERWDDWLGPWKDLAVNQTFERGFLASLQLTSRAGVGLEDYPASFSPHLDLLHTLVFSRTGIAEDVLLRVDRASLPCLRRIVCERCMRGNNIVKVLAAFPTTTTITSLAIQDCRIGPNAVKALCRAPWIANLRALDLSHNPFEPRGVAALGNCPHLAHLNELDLSGYCWNEETEQLAKWARSGLKSLAFGSGPHGPTVASVEKVLQAPAFSSLRSLRIGAAVSGEIERLHACPLLSRVVHLDLQCCELTDGDVEELARAPWTSELRELVLASGLITDAGVMALAGSPVCSNLTFLDLSCSTIGEQGLQALTRSPHLSNLVTLFLGIVDTNCTNVLAELGTGKLPKLRNLRGMLSDSRTEEDRELIAQFRERGIHFDLDVPSWV
jgi:uncharacterized protein (TIGR02996 family)